MADVAGLGIKIDSAGAKAGANEVIRAMQGILDQAKKVTGGVDETSNSFEKLKKGGGIIQTLKDHWLALSVGAVGAIAVIRKAWDTLKAEGAEQAMERGLDRLLAKYKLTSSEIMKELQKASNGIISRDEALEIAARGLAMGLDPKSIVAFATNVERVAQVMGASFTESMKGVELAAMSGMSKTVKQSLGLQVDFTKAVEDYANKLKISKDVMTEDEMVKARMAHMLELLRKKHDELLPTQQSVYLKQQQMIAQWADMKDTLEGKLLGAVTAVYNATDKWGAILTGVAAGGVAYFVLGAAAAAVNAYKMAAGVGAITAALKILHLAMLKNPIFWIATALGLGAAAWYEYSQGVKAAAEAEKDYIASIKTMPEDQMAKEKAAAQSKIKGLDDVIAKLKEVRAEEEKRDNVKILPQGKVEGTGMKWSLKPVDTSWAYQSTADLKEAEEKRKKYSDVVGEIEKRETAVVEVEAAKRRAARSEEIASAIKAIDELKMKATVAQASTRGGFLEAKTLEFNAKFNLSDIDWKGPLEQYRSVFLKAVGTEWDEMVTAANRAAVAETQNAARQMADAMDSALGRAGLMDEGDAMRRKYERDTEALRDSLKEQETIRDSHESSIGKKEKIAAEARINILKKQIIQKPQEQELDRIALATKTAETIREIEMSTLKDVNAAAERMNQERVASGLMTETAAIRERYAARREEIRVEIDSLEISHGKKTDALERLKIEADISRLERERRNLPAFEKADTGRSDLIRAKADIAVREAALTGKSVRIDTAEMMLDITREEAARRRIVVLLEEKEIKEDSLRILKQGTPEEVAAYRLQETAVLDVNKRLLEQQKLLQDRTAWSGSKAAMMEYMDSATNWGAQMNEVTTTAFTGMEDALVDFVKTGKGSFKDLADSIIADLIRISVKQSITGPLAKGLLSVLGGVLGGSSGQLSTGAELAAYSENAKGNAFDRYANVIPFRKGGVVDRETMFRFSKGIGTMSEGGIPEAIMPLARLPGGDLGVRSAGGGGSSTINVTVPVSVVEGQASVGGPQAGGGMTPDVARALSVMIRTKVVEVIQDQRRAGGLLG